MLFIFLFYLFIFFIHAIIYFYILAIIIELHLLWVRHMILAVDYPFVTITPRSTMTPPEW